MHKKTPIFFTLLGIVYFFCCCQSGKLTEKKTNIKEETDSLTITTNTKVEQTPENPFYQLILNPKEQPMFGYKKFDFSKHFTEREITGLNLDTNKIDRNAYYRLTDECFLREDVEGVSFKIYHMAYYGNYLAKMLRVERTDTIFDILLSAFYSNGMDLDSWSTEFGKDSIFTYSEVNEVCTRDDQYAVSYDYDSIVSRYRYDELLNLTLLTVDTFRYSDERFINKDGSYYTHLKKYSQPFRFQGKECVWEYVIEYYRQQYDAHKCTSLYKLNLLEYPSREIIMNGMGLDVEMKAEAPSPSFPGGIIDYKLLDVNFDGYDDIVIRNNKKSGNIGIFSDSYIFNPSKGIFEYAENFSGYNLAADPKKKMLHCIKRNSLAEDFFLDIAGNTSLTHQDSLQVVRFWKKSLTQNKFPGASIYKLLEIKGCDSQVQCETSVAMAPDKSFMVFISNCEWSGKFSCETNLFTSSGREFPNIHVYNIKEIHVMPDGKYLILSDGEQYGIWVGNPVNLAYLISFKDDSLVFHPFEFTYPKCLVAYYKEQRNIRLELEEGYSETNNEPYLDYNPKQHTLTYQYAPQFPPNCNEPDTIYRYKGELRYIDGVFKQVSETATVLKRKTNP